MDEKKINSAVWKIGKWLAIAVLVFAAFMWLKEGSGSGPNAGSTSQPNPSNESVGQATVWSPDQVTVAKKYSLVKARKPGEAVYNGPKVLYSGFKDKETGHIVLRLEFNGTIQKFSWLPAPAGTWIQGGWSKHPIYGEPSEGEGGLIQVFEQPGGKFLINRYHHNEQDPLKWELTYTGEIFPEWTAG